VSRCSSVPTSSGHSSYSLPSSWTACVNDNRLAEDLDAFYLEHRGCGELRADVDDLMVWIGCDCGAVIARRIDAAQRWRWTLAGVASAQLWLRSSCAMTGQSSSWSTSGSTRGPASG
jgi:hypothetical protein